MKKITLKRLLFLLLFISQISFGQKLSLSDIENICNKSNWEGVNQFLMNKNWEYYESEKGNSEKYSKITWSFEKTYGDKASAWFYLYTYEGFPNKLSYSVFNKPSYSAIQNSLSSKGYKLQNSEIENNELISTYANSKFILKITTEKREKDNYSSFDESITAYRFLLIKKSSIYDPDNGKKVDYYYGDTKEAEYTKINGEIDGALKVYYENGKLKKTGYYKKGLANGNFIEYDEKENKTFEYYQSDDKKNGKLISYEDNKISYSTHYKDDIQNGERIDYLYDDESGRLYLKMIGTFLNGEKEGNWRLIFIDKEKGEITLTKTTYSKGLKNGFSQDIKGDSLIISNYLNDKLDGNFKVYLDVTKTVFGGVIETDISKLFLLSEGKYQNDKKSDYWKYYSLTKSLSSEGNYLNDEKTGEWKNYHSKYTNEDKPTHYSEKLYLIENYNRDKLNGLSTRFSYLNKEKYKCSELDENNKPKDSCIRMVYQKVFEKSNYKNNKLNGAFESKDSLDILVAKGNFANDQKVGKWFHRFEDEDYEGNPYIYYMEGSYENDEREGEWIYYYKKGEINKTINYSNGEFDGKFTEWNNQNKPKEIKRFEYGKFKELIVYDSIGQKPERKFEIFDEYSNRYKCRFTQYFSNGKISQVYWVKKEKDIGHNWFEISFLLKLKEKDKSIIYRDGEYKDFDIDGRPLIIGEYFEESKIGDWIYYYYPQKVKIEIEYDDNINIGEKYLTITNELYSGDFTFLDNDKKIKEIRSIKNGLRNGNTEFIDINTGKRINKVKYKDGKIK
jgi:antitoxin component YwqK of YwqJK toxin-antitoxin module